MIGEMCLAVLAAIYFLGIEVDIVGEALASKLATNVS